MDEYLVSIIVRAVYVTILGMATLFWARQPQVGAPKILPWAYGMLTFAASWGLAEILITGQAIPTLHPVLAWASQVALVTIFIRHIWREQQRKNAAELAVKIAEEVVADVQKHVDRINEIASEGPDDHAHT